MVLDSSGVHILHTWRGKLPHYCTIYQAELLAIRKACQWITSNSPANIWSDSLSSLHSIRTARLGTPLLREVVDGWPTGVVASYIPAHSGHWGNELADQLAKQAATEGEPVHLPCPKGHIKRALRDWSFSEWKDRWASYHSQRSPVKLFFPSLQLIRRSLWSKGRWFDSLCKLLLGRSPLAGDHWWADEETDLDCHCGQGTEDTAHFLFFCPMHNHARSSWDLPINLPLHAKFEWLGHHLGELKQFIDDTGRFSHSNPAFQDMAARLSHLFQHSPYSPYPLPADLI